MAYKIKRKHEEDLLSELRHRRNMLTVRKSDLFKKVNVETSFIFHDYFLYKNYTDDEIQKVDAKIKTIEDSQHSYQDNHSSDAVWISQLLQFEKELLITKEMLVNLISTICINGRDIDVSFMYSGISMGGYLHDRECGHE